MLSWRGVFTGGAIVVATSVVLLVTSASGTACPDNPSQLRDRVNQLQGTFSSAAGADMKTIGACTTLDCSRPGKLDMASALESFNDGLEKICWPGHDEPKVDALAAANSSLAEVFLQWAEATGPIDEQALAAIADAREHAQSSAERALTSSLH
jgi:hypothetical protein